MSVPTVEELLAGAHQLPHDEQAVLVALINADLSLRPRTIEEEEEDSRRAIAISNTLTAYLRLLFRPRRESYDAIPDGSDILDCLAYGFSKLVEEIKFSPDIVGNGEAIKALDDLDARLGQVAYSSKHWRSYDERQSVIHYAEKFIELTEGRFIQEVTNDHTNT